MTIRLLILLFSILAGLARPPSSMAQSSAALGNAVEQLKGLPAAQMGTSLAAETSGEAHWTFVNPAGERFTTASVEELKRVVPTLAPEAAKPGARLTLLLTEDTVFRWRQHLQALALANDRRTDLMVSVDGKPYPLLRRGERAHERLYAEVRSSLLIELNERRLFDEAVWQLAHPLKRASIRTLALEPGGPQGVPSIARIDPQSQRPLTDLIAPGSLIPALATLARQTVLITARRDGDMLAFRPSSGAEQTLPLKDVLAAAEANDVNLVLLQSATPRQPGTRSWLWQRVSVGRLDEALARDHIGDFLNAVASPQSKLLVGVEEQSASRVRLVARPLRDDSSPRTGIGEAIGDLVSNIAGQVVISSVEASLRDRARQQELDRRLVPGVPSIMQWTYLALLLIGLLGHRVAYRWWERMWPADSRESYGFAFGFHAARSIRWGIYGLLFAPLVAIASAPAVLLGLSQPRRRGALRPPEEAARVPAT